MVKAWGLALVGVLCYDCKKGGGGVNYQSSVGVLSGVGPKKESYLKDLGLLTLMDLAFHFPFRYEDWSQLKAVDEVLSGEDFAYLGKLLELRESTSQRGKAIVRGLFSGEQGMVEAMWFNQKWLSKSLRLQGRYLLYGKRNDSLERIIWVKDYHYIPSEKMLKDFLKLYPIYSSSAQISSKEIEKLEEQIFTFMKKFPLPELLTSEALEKYQLLSINESIKSLHLPKNLEEVNQARHSMIVYEWLFFLAWAGNLGKNDSCGNALLGSDKLYWSLIEQLPFSLTSAQQKVIKEIKEDLENSLPMRRLLQGDVGSGKTLVALYTLLKGVASKGQSVLLAPTEILAMQHYEKIKTMLKDSAIKLAFYSAQVKGKERDELLKALKNGELDIIIGTHALLEKEVIFQQLFVVVIDEQHRFGVKQRALLYEKGKDVDVLVMTATPIPRSLAMSVYGNLSHSVIDQLPLGRKAIHTYWVSDKKREDLYHFIEKHLLLGEQAYFVCPLISESEVLDLKNAEALYNDLTKRFYPHRVGLLHGKMKGEEKAQIMKDFLEKRLSILVSTTVIEVGIDVKNASIMVIENAERFGLAQLHQLRGRVGRGTTESYAFLMSNATSDEARKRMEIMVKSTDGFKIAEEDLKLRGPGELLGFRQHGLPSLKIADFRQHLKELLKAREIYQKEEIQHSDYYVDYLKASVKV